MNRLEAIYPENYMQQAKATEWHLSLSIDIYRSGKIWIVSKRYNRQITCSKLRPPNDICLSLATFTGPEFRVFCYILQRVSDEKSRNNMEHSKHCIFGHPDSEVNPNVF